MARERQPTVAIVDYGMGNLFSVARACERVDLHPQVTSDSAGVLAADGLILPGVGAFGSAMEALNRAGLSHAILTFIKSGRPFLGVCLGIQLLMTSSEEFGAHAGLGVIEGRVVRFASHDRVAKVPHMQWNRTYAVDAVRWRTSLLRSQRDGEYFYFVHSYYIEPADSAVVVATTRYAGVEFVSAIQKDNIFACQFHPERSGARGLAIYADFAGSVQARRRG